MRATPLFVILRRARSAQPKNLDRSAYTNAPSVSHHNRPDEMSRHHDRNRSRVVAIDSERRALGTIGILRLRASRSPQNDTGKAHHA